ncbi:ATP-dependent Clp protease adapter ClpS [Megalodesulfovibrio gigas]|uniref:ATP-dependent Clp protease adapter protein ClpS n=1 Tax=Megalodesulfovibrio gigas (strain ATCC 19364 / DSM 1382 / NCIMB 9332 / VKM B-1759) TaxID=1121448 RepID=T2GFS9_MEGG1|nr:ATP-dependent Clp protease adapter ClpS [Megalodesulfovibrio gigas]AGW15153.1 putative ATP-dependent Clp protease adaptor protein ClpS [Megalodesulfovibrio gigas DSM 1382 = ATCC 19364]
MTEPYHQPGASPDVHLEDNIQEPRRYKVLLLNDDYTTMEFVVRILREVFKKSEAEATRIMRMVHELGKGVCGVYPAEIAETKVSVVHARARSEGFPLRCTMEEA